MIFNEIYGTYYNVVEKILREAVKGKLTNQKIYDITRDNAFGESITAIPDNLINGKWPLINGNFETPIKHEPATPLTIIEKMWIKAILMDKRIQLFEPDMKVFEDVEPLYMPGTFVYYDRYKDSDPYEDIKYKENFRLILLAIKNKHMLTIKYKGKKGVRWHNLIPMRLEYSSKDDKFRMISQNLNGTVYVINLKNIIRCNLMEKFNRDDVGAIREEKKEVILKLTDERDALKRAMLSFSDLEKETVRLDEKNYSMKLKYYSSDENEILIRILEFGPFIKVESPEEFVEKIRERLRKQRRLWNKTGKD